MNTYKTSAQLKALARDQLPGRYGIAIEILFFLLSAQLFFAMLSTTLIDRTTLINYLIYCAVALLIQVMMGILTLGHKYFYMSIIRGWQFYIRDIFMGFKQHTDKVIVIQAVFVGLSFLLILPATIFDIVNAFLQQNANAWTGTAYWTAFLITIVVSLIIAIISIYFRLMFSQAFFLTLDFPQYSTKELMYMSKDMMKGHKGRLFYIYVSFIPLYLLALFSCCIGFFFVIPYQNATLANFYSDLIENKQTGSNPHTSAEL